MASSVVAHGLSLAVALEPGSEVVVCGLKVRGMGDLGVP